jgi:hypothetical protein
MNRGLRFATTITLALAVLLPMFVGGAPEVKAADGAQFKAGRIIDDSIFANPNATSVEAVQAMLNSQMPSCDTYGAETSELGGGTRAQYGAAHGNPIPFTCLRDYYEVPKTSPGGGAPASNYGGQPIPAGAKSAAQLIYDAGQAYGINPQVLVVTLQKEQRLLTDEWPFKNQYLYAMGAHCPDGPNGAECDPNYSGFSLQIREGARLFRYYLDNMNQPWWPYAKPGQNSILYNVSERESVCGRKSVMIETRATAALYTYTPYTPNDAALIHLYTAVPGNPSSPSDWNAYCAAYGNRNFWRMFTDMYGSTLGDSFFLAMSDNGDPRQWVVQNGKRHHVPSPEIIRAYGLDNFPLLVLPGTQLGSYVDGPALTRLIRPAGSLDVFFVDNGNRWRLTSTAQMAAWDLDPGKIVDVSLALSLYLADEGNLGYSLQQEGQPNIYMVDGDQLRHLQNPQTLQAFEGTAPSTAQVSADYIGSWSVGAPLSHSRIIDPSNNQYVVSGKTRMYLSPTTAAMYPWAAQLVSSQTIARMGQIEAPLFMRPDGGAEVYLIDQGLKHHIADPGVLGSWITSTDLSDVVVVPPGLIDLISGGDAVSSGMLTVGGQTRVIDGGLRPIPGELASAYTTGKSIYSGSTELASLLNTAGSVTGLLRSSTGSKVHLITNSGQRRHITSSQLLSMWGGVSPSVTVLSQGFVADIPSGSSIGGYVNDGSSSFVMSSATKLAVDGATATKWGLASPAILSDGTLSRFASGSALDDEFKISGTYYLINNGNAYATVDQNIATIWAVHDAPAGDPNLVSQLLDIKMLTRFARSTTPGDTRIFAVEGGNLFHLSPDHLTNLGYQASQSIAAINPSSYDSSIATWTAIAIKNSSDNKVYVIDAGKKRQLPSGTIQNHWLNNGSIVPLSVSNSFVSLLTSGAQMERAIKGSAANIYSAEDVTKKWIQSWSTYQSQYAPYTSVSDSLVNVLPTGASIP